MKCALTVVGCSLLLTAAGLAAPPTAPARLATPTLLADNQELPLLLAKLSELSEFIGRNTEAPTLWRYQLAQGEVLLQIAAHSKPEERDSWVRMAVDSYESAAVLSPDNQPTAHERLVQIASTFPGSSVSTYAVLQEIQADYQRMLSKAGANPAKAQEHLRDRLVLFAQEYPKAAEAPEAILEAGQISESLGKTIDARQYYRYLTEHFAGKALSRKAGRALWRLGLAGEPMHLKLPLLYPPDARDDHAFDLSEVRGKVAVIYFWSSTSAQAGEDFRALKELTDHHRDHGLEVIYVNMDSDPAEAKAFLSGRLLAGIHVFQRGGLDSPIAERYGIQTLPQAFVIDKDGVVMRHGLPTSQLEPEVLGRLVRAP